MQVSPFNGSNKKDLQILRGFIIKTGDQTWIIRVRYTISQYYTMKLVKGSKNIFATQFSRKSSKINLEQKRGEYVLGEKVKEGYKQYELHATVDKKRFRITI